MALICPVCNAENREGANFCRSCGGKLAPAAPVPMAPPPAPDSRSEREWAATAPAQLRAPTIPGGLFDASLPLASQVPYANAASPADEKTVIVGARRSKRPPSPPREPRVKKASRPRTSRPAGAEVRKRSRMRDVLLWLVLLAVGLLMIVAGWYGYGKDKPDEKVEVTAPAASSAAPAAAPTPLVPVSEAPAAAPQPPPAQPSAAETTPAAPAPATSAGASPKPLSPAAAAKARKAASAAPSQPGAPEPAPAATAASPSAPSAAASADPQSACADRNFIAKAQCMAAQCLKAEYKPHAQCEAVRRQQRIEEEKRNPTLVN